MSVHYEPLERITSPRTAARKRCHCGKPGAFRAHGFGVAPKVMCADCESGWEPEEGFGGMPRYETGEDRDG